MNIILADNQDITRAGLIYLLERMKLGDDIHIVTDKIELMYRLKEDPTSVVIVDYTLFDLNDVSSLENLSMRFKQAMFVLFSDDLSPAFVSRLLASVPKSSILLKDSPMFEIRACIEEALKGQRYICQHAAGMLVATETQKDEAVKLTKTEKEILKDIAMGMTTKEIAAKRFSSFHTVNTHRKNIFRKLGVNNAHEATKYALRAGIVDEAEYYI